MLRGIAVAAALFSLFAFPLGHAWAQSPSSTTVEINLDARAGGGGASKKENNGQIYNRTVRINSAFTPNLGVHFFGTEKALGSSVQEASLVGSLGAQQLQAGIVRLPFGIYNYQETYASGIIDYAMPRVDYRYNSVDWGVPGVQFSGGVPKLRVEAAGFGGRSYGVWENEASVGGAAVRLQTYTNNGFIFGASRWDGIQETLPTPKGTNAPVHLNGLDMRFTQGHWLLRGEYIAGELSGNQMHGAYLDSYYRLPRYQAWTLASRIEDLRPGGGYPAAHQLTLGVRYVATPNWTLTVNWRRNNMSDAYATTWTPYSGSGALLFQAYYRIRLGQ